MYPGKTIKYPILSQTLHRQACHNALHPQLGCEDTEKDIMQLKCPQISEGSFLQSLRVLLLKDYSLFFRVRVVVLPICFHEVVTIKSSHCVDSLSLWRVRLCTTHGKCT